MITKATGTNVPEYIIGHHTGGTNDNPLADTSHHTFRMVDAWHRQDPNVWLGYTSSRGFAIGYHYFIERDGTEYQGRDDTDEGAHCRFYNKRSIGIALAGNFDLTRPTKEQEAALKRRLGILMDKYGIPAAKLVPHRAFADKTCFGRNLPDDYMRKLIEPSAPPVCTLRNFTTGELITELASRFKRA